MNLYVFAAVGDYFGGAVGIVAPDLEAACRINKRHCHWGRNV